MHLYEEYLAGGRILGSSARVPRGAQHARQHALGAHQVGGHVGQDGAQAREGGSLQGGAQGQGSVG